MINVTSYKVNNRKVFTHTQLWSSHEPTIELDSKKHGDLAVTFKKDGSIELTYWSPRIPIDAENVRPTNLVLRP